MHYPISSSSSSSLSPPFFSSSSFTETTFSFSSFVRSLKGGSHKGRLNHISPLKSRTTLALPPPLTVRAFRVAYTDSQASAKHPRRETRLYPAPPIRGPEISWLAAGPLHTRWRFSTISHVEAISLLSLFAPSDDGRLAASLTLKASLPEAKVPSLAYIHGKVETTPDGT